MQVGSAFIQERFKMMLLIIVCAVVVIGVITVYMYNHITHLNVLADEAWSGINIQLKRRYDLIPNLVEIVKGYVHHEQELFQKLALMRSAAMGTSIPGEKIKAEGTFSATLKTLFAVAESYPELKANTTFKDLHKSLDVIEHEIQLSRRYYNGVVREYNTRIVVFPSSIIASIAHFKVRPYFELAEECEHENPRITF